jgi:hypothetical protein
MGDVPVLKPREVAAILVASDSVRYASEVRTASTGTRIVVRRTTVPFHPGRDVAPALLRAIARDIGMDIRDFVSRI